MGNLALVHTLHTGQEMSWAPGRAAADAAAKAWLRDQQLPALVAPPPPKRAPGYNTPRLTAEQTKHVAAALRRELYNDAGPQTLAQVRTRIVEDWREEHRAMSRQRKQEARAVASRDRKSVV